MSIKKNYFEYLKHFRQTITVGELNAQAGKRNLVALRHDVDYDIDIALEMSYWEYRNSIRSTFFVLPNSPYWQDPELLNKCLQIQDFGHEIGLHVNIIAEWMKGLIDDPLKGLYQQLSSLRSAGIKIAGIAAHGDPLCYSNAFINYWVFKELRPENPELRESGLSAEGIFSTGDRQLIKYPKNHQIVRDNGDTLPLWTVSMKQLEIDYHAIHVSHDHYFTDTGGEWKRSADPLDVDLTVGRNQILIHPEYWRGQQKVFFFLSCARSGSKWLSLLLEEASSLTSRHEFMLNHRVIDGNLLEDKRTADGFTDLQDNSKKVLELLLDIRPWVEKLARDYAEVNVYLEHFLDELQEAYPEAVIIHLHRQPCEVISSILNRDWYDTPEDNRHPTFGIGGWKKLSPFQRACWYVRMVNDELLKNCSHRLGFQTMISDPTKLGYFLDELNIAFYPRLAAPIYQKKINANTRNEFPPYKRWRQEQKDYYHDTCDIINGVLGYPIRHDLASYIRNTKNFIKKVWSIIYTSDSSTLNGVDSNQKPLALEVDFSAAEASPGALMEINDFALQLTPQVERNAYVLFGGGNWNNLHEEKGWKVQLAHYYRGSLEAEIPDKAKGTARLICLMYDKDGKILGQRPLVRVRTDSKMSLFSFRPVSTASSFNIALYMPANDLPKKITVKSLSLEMLPLGFEI